MYKHLYLFIIVLWPVSVVSAETLHSLKPPIQFQKSTDSIHPDENIIYITDTTYLPPDTIKVTDTLRIYKAVKKARTGQRYSKTLYFGETFGSLWAFSASQWHNNTRFSTNSIANQQLVIHFGKITNDWKYYLRFSQSRFAENALQTIQKPRADTIYTPDSVYVKTYTLTEKTRIKNYYVYSCFGAGISNQLGLDRNNNLTLHPSVHTGILLPWKAPALELNNNQITPVKMRPPAAVLIAINCGVYIKLRENMRFVVLPEYSHLFVMKNKAPYANRNVFNIHIGILISTY